MLICRCDVSNCLLWKATNDTDHNDQSKNNDPFLFAWLVSALRFALLAAFYFLKKVCRVPVPGTIHHTWWGVEELCGRVRPGAICRQSAVHHLPDTVPGTVLHTVLYAGSSAVMFFMWALLTVIFLSLLLSVRSREGDRWKYTYWGHWTPTYWPTTYVIILLAHWWYYDS